MAKCIWIWYMLSQSIPCELRHHFTLVPDPAAGTVAVTAQRLRLTRVGLWKVPRENGMSRKIRTRQRSHYMIHRGAFEIWRTPGVLSRRAMRALHLCKRPQEMDIESRRIKIRNLSNRTTSLLLCYAAITTSLVMTNNSMLSLLSYSTDSG